MPWFIASSITVALSFICNIFVLWWAWPRSEKVTEYTQELMQTALVFFMMGIFACDNVTLLASNMFGIVALQAPLTDDQVNVFAK